MRIVIDLQGTQTGSRFRGIGRYSLSLAKAIVRNKKKHEVIIVISSLLSDTIEDVKSEFQNLLPLENIKIWNGVGPTREGELENDTNREISEVIRETFLSTLNPDIVLIVSLFEGYYDDAISSVKKIDNATKVVVVLYDLIPLVHKDKYLSTNAVYEAHYMRKLAYLKKADLLLGISESSSREAIECLGFDQAKVATILSAVDESFVCKTLTYEEKQSLYKKYSLTKKTIVYAPGGFDIRKNFENLIKAYARLPKEQQDEYQLVIVSKVDDGNRERLQRLAKDEGISKNNLVLTGYVSHDELVAFYSTCDLFVFPSIHEGFGLPVLEAMNCGAVVIGSNTTSIPEVIGCEEALFDPYSIGSIRDKIMQVLTDKEFQNKLKEHNKKQIQKFSWDRSAAEAINAMESIMGSNSGSYISEGLAIQAISQCLIEYDLSGDTILIENIANALYRNRQEAQCKTLWIDVTQIRMQDFATGIQRVVKAVLEQIFRIDNLGYDIKLIYLEHGSQQSRDYGWVYRYAFDYQNLLLKKEVSGDNYIVEPKNGDIFLGLDLISYVVEAEKDKLFTYLRDRGVEINFVVYDILPVMHPEWWPQGGSEVHTKWIETILKVSHKLLCISEAVTNDIRLWVDRNDIEVASGIEIDYFHLGADITNSKPSKGLPSNANSVLEHIKSRPSFIMVGTLEPRKGHLQTLKAFDLLWKQGVDINLVIVGKQGWMVDELINNIQNHSELNKKLFWLNGISDEYLEKVYKSSTCLIAASEGEGFGLPLIEAAQHKKPIIARDIPVFREVAGEFAYFFENSNEPQVLQKAIKEWIKLYKNDQHPKSDAMPWLTWKESAKMLMNKITKH